MNTKSENSRTLIDKVLQKDLLKISISSVIVFLFLINYIIMPHDFRIGDTVSFEYLKQWGIIFVCLFILLNRKIKLSQGKSERWLLIIFTFLVVYLTASLMWSISVATSMRYINKVWLTLAMALVALTCDPSDLKPFIKYFGIMIIFFVGLSFVSDLLLRDFVHAAMKYDVRFIGFSGIHSTKYLMTIGTIYFLILGLVRKKRSLYIWSFVCFIVALLSLQRALIAGLFVSIGVLFVVYLLRERRFKILIGSFFFFISLIFLAYFLVFRYEPIRSRMFYSDKHATLAEEIVFSPRIFEVYSLIQKSGRERFWSAAENNPSPVRGNGFGTAGYIIEREIGQYWEMHNDYLKLYVETGYIGVVFYILFILLYIIVVSRKIIRSRNLQSLGFYYISLGIFMITPINGIFDNALDHIAKNICYSLIFFILAFKIENKQHQVCL